MRSLSDDHILTERQRAISLQEANPTPLQFVDIRPAPVRDYSKPGRDWARFAWRVAKFATALLIIVTAVFLAAVFLYLNWS